MDDLPELRTRFRAGGPGEAVTVPWKIDYASHKSALYAVTNWHYTGCLPSGRRYIVGVWEDEQFIGVIIFAKGANPYLGRAYGLHMSEMIELTRVALAEHQNPVTMYVAAALRLLRSDNPGLRLAVSFADPVAGHHGGIYQAGGWIYCGKGADSRSVKANGHVYLMKAAHRKGWRGNIDWIRENVDPNAYLVDKPGKYRYLYPFDRQMRRLVEKMREPAPGRVER